MELCILIPAKNEVLTLTKTIENLHKKLNGTISYSIMIVNDHSDDGTLELLENLASKDTKLKYVTNDWDGGVGSAIRFGLTIWKEDIVALCMADGSDSPDDILSAYKKINDEGFDCVFGSRFIKGASVKNYPFIKLLLNRLFNTLVRIVTRNKYNDFTNIFKVYHRKSIDEIYPLNSTGFSIGLEMSLKAFKKKLNISIVPISWTQREAGVSKLKLIKNFKLYMSTFLKSINNEVKK